MTARFAVDPGIPTWCDPRVHASMEPSFEDVGQRASSASRGEIALARGLRRLVQRRTVVAWDPIYWGDDVIRQAPPTKLARS